MSAIVHTSVMGAVTKALGDGRMAAFREDPSQENIDAILAVVARNLKLLARGKSLPAATSKPAKTAKVAKREPKETEDKPAKRNPLAKQFAVGTKVRLEIDGERCTGTVTLCKLKGAKVKTRDGDTVYRRFSGLTAIKPKA